MRVVINSSGLGNVVRGHLFDTNKKFLERELRAYDSQLYLKWNPLKAINQFGKTRFNPPEGEHWRGFASGCWELRRLPNEKTAVPTWEYKDTIVCNLEYLELDIINCIKDFRYLTYDILKFVQDSDTWSVKNFAHELEYQEDKSYEKELDASQDDLRYAIKSERRAMQDFQEELRSGKNPLEFLSGAWDPRFRGNHN